MTHPTSHDSIYELTQRILAFRDARDWKPFHSPKEMAVAIAAEAGELLQHFVWQSPEQSLQRIADRKDAIAAEMADVAILLFEMADLAGVNLGAAIDSKLRRNEERYPLEKARGSNKKYNEL
jgi:dCTP diphosphatase